MLKSKFFQYFRPDRLSVIGMVHVLPLPGTPAYENSPSAIDLLVDRACKECAIYLKYGLHGICIENMFDRPYVSKDAATRFASPEITATMTRICTEIRRMVPVEIPCGVQVLAGFNQEALAIALASGLQFIRAEGFVFSHVADEGLQLQASAGPLLRYRKQIQADHICILTDIKKKHCSHSITADVDLNQTARAAQFFLSDGLILTGSETGHSPTPTELNQICQEMQNEKTMENLLPILIGSGITAENLPKFSKANAVIVGSYFKHNGKWFNEICSERVGKLMQSWKQIV